MSNREKELYLVSEGTVTSADVDTSSDVENSVLCFAENEDAALELATQYDAGQAEFGNVAIDGVTVACLSQPFPR